MLGIRHYHKTAIDLYQGDITRFVCDGIVNAANESLLGGGGVDGAIHRAGGPSILEECRAIGGCKTGQAVATTAGNLPAQKVIHTVGPIWRDGKAGESELLKSAVIECLKLSVSLKLSHLAFPAISTGVYGYPVDKAAEVMLKAVSEFLDAQPEGSVRRITFVLFDGDTYRKFQDTLFRLFPED
ncbi:MAG: O-acetyl-ADP-ribose deacetylase [Proteobacteria bacterium]|nr:MAG: O-acetyl-ADP-ribose deacetylase [Pseudomonadota bacterium]